MSFNAIPENGWPQLKRLDELAKKVGNIPTFTSSDKEALEDLISNAQALIEVAEDGAEGVPFDNTGTDFESTDVQSAIEEAASMGGGGDVYSETPVKIGTYDGHDLYRKLFKVAAFPNNTVLTINSGLTNEVVIGIKGMCHIDVYDLPIPYISLISLNNGIECSYGSTAHQIYITTKADKSEGSGYIAVDYYITEV